MCYIFAIIYLDINLLILVCVCTLYTVLVDVG